jgi:hypothetical protein
MTPPTPERIANEQDWNVADAWLDLDLPLDIRVLVEDRCHALELIENGDTRDAATVRQAEVAEMARRKPELPAPPRPVKAFERGRWITRERDPRRMRGRERCPTARRGTTRARRSKAARRLSSSASRGDPGGGDTGEGEGDLARRIAEYAEGQGERLDEVIGELAEADAEIRRLRGEGS